jgi:hypothetical protein
VVYLQASGRLKCEAASVLLKPEVRPEEDFIFVWVVYDGWKEQKSVSRRPTVMERPYRWKDIELSFLKNAQQSANVYCF